MYFLKEIKMLKVVIITTLFSLVLSHKAGWRDPNNLPIETQQKYHLNERNPENSDRLESCDRLQNIERACNVHMKHLFGYFVDLLKLNEFATDSTALTYDATIDIQHSDAELLMKLLLVNDLTPAQLIDGVDVIKSLFSNVHLRQSQEIKSSWSSTVARSLWPIIQYFCVVFTIFICIDRALKLSRGQYSAIFLFIGFWLSVAWNWAHLYQIARMERMSLARKSVPDECIGDYNQRTSILETFSKYLHSFAIIPDKHDKCYNYYKDLFIDPIWEVPPMTAFMHTITQVLVTPLQMLSSALGEAMANFLRELPIIYHIPALILLLVFIIAILCVWRGYGVSAIYGLVSVGPHHPPPPPPVTERLTDGRRERAMLSNIVSAPSIESSSRQSSTDSSTVRIRSHSVPRRGGRVTER